MTKVTAESIHKIVIPDFNILVSVDMRVLKSGRLCRPGQHSLGGVLDTALAPMAIWLKTMLRMALSSLRCVDSDSPHS